MQLIIQERIKNNPNNLKFLRENSNYYKYLNRNSAFFKQFEEQMKEAYKLTPADRIKKISKGLDTFSKVMDVLN